MDSTIVAALIALAGSAAGAWLGAKLALRSFKHERAFEKRLEWHVKTIRFLLNMSSNLAVARTIERELKEGRILYP